MRLENEFQYELYVIFIVIEHASCFVLRRLGFLESISSKYILQNANAEKIAANRQGNGINEHVCVLYMALLVIKMYASIKPFMTIFAAVVFACAISIAHCTLYVCRVCVYELHSQSTRCVSRSEICDML